MFLAQIDMHHNCKHITGQWSNMNHVTNINRLILRMKWNLCQVINPNQENVWRQRVIQARLPMSIVTSLADEKVPKNGEWWGKRPRFWRKHILVGREEAWMLRVGSLDTLPVLDCQWSHCLGIWVHWQSRMPFSPVRKGAMPTTCNMKDTKGFSDFLVQRGVLTGSDWTWQRTLLA